MGSGSHSTTPQNAKSTAIGGSSDNYYLHESKHLQRSNNKPYVSQLSNNQHDFGQDKRTPTNVASSLVVNSMKYLRNTPQRQDSVNHLNPSGAGLTTSLNFDQHKPSGALNSSGSGLTHSNVLLKAQNM